MLCFVCNIRAKIPSDDTMPSWVVLLVKLFLDKGGDVFLNVELFHGLCCTLHSILLHVLRHVGIFDYSFPFGHLENRNKAKTVISRNRLVLRSIYLAKKRGYLPFKTTPIPKSSRKTTVKVIELLTLSKNSFPQLSQTFATEIPFSNN